MNRKGILLRNIFKLLYRIDNDEVTKCKNRAWYDEVAKRKYQPKDIWCTFVDIDYLKQINDTHGHFEGTEKIKEVALYLKSLPICDIVRYGGDEFILFSTNELKIDFSGVSYSCYHKECYEDVSSAVRKSDIGMYAMKHEHHKNV